MRFEVDQPHVQQRAVLDVEAAGPQRILNMPSSMLGREVSDIERQASRFRVRACSPEARGDAHTMLYMIAEKEEGPAAAVPHLLACIGCAVKRQKVDAHANLAKIYDQLGEHEKRDEQISFAKALKEKVEADEAEEARKKAEDEAKKAEDDEPPLPEVPDNPDTAEEQTKPDEDAVMAD